MYIGYIYKITNSMNNKVYIGQAIEDYEVRWRGHKTDLRGNRHINKRLQEDWNLYGEDTFSFELITKVTGSGEHIEVITTTLEDTYIILFDSMNPDKGYNLQEPLTGNCWKGMTEQERKERKDSIIKTYKKKAKNENKIHSNSKLYGYEYKDGCLVIIPEEAEIIKLIYQLYLEGNGVLVISNILKEKGIRSREGKLFNKNTVMTILSNEKYAGINNRMKHSKYLMNNEEYKEYLKMNENIEPIISTETFNKVEQILQSKQSNGRGLYQGNSPYAGKIKCASCGASYTANKDKGRPYYNCSVKRSKGLKYCDGRNISVSKLTKLLNNEWLIQSLYYIKANENLNEFNVKNKYTEQEILDMIYRIDVASNTLYVSLLVEDEIIQVEPLAW